jgi:hypothetical protein
MGISVLIALSLWLFWFAEAPYHQCRQACFITFAGVLCLAGADDVGVYRVFFMAGTADTPAANDITPLDRPDRHSDTAPLRCWC